jgi:hypothetical protein
MHELYSAPAKGWENIYINQHRTGVGTYQSCRSTITFELIFVAANILRPVTINGQEYQPIANASRGTLSTQKGRLRQPKLSSGKKDLEKQEAPYVEY